jgi:Stigma-specific protein, Stig1
MTLPGFDAERSLYKSSTIYRSYSGRGQSSSVVAEEDIIEPAFVCNPTKLQSCMNDNQIPSSIREVVCVRLYGDCSLFQGRTCTGSGDSRECTSSPVVTCGGLPCPPPLACCDGVCTNLTLDAEHCGNCLTSCGPTHCCINGACRTNTRTDPQNCGTCGVVCPPGTSCSGGWCVTGAGALPLNSNSNYLLVNCDTYPNCSGASCKNIENLSVYFKVGHENMVAAVTPYAGGSSTSNGGFTIQLNAYNPSGPVTLGMQYVFLISGNQIKYQVQYWNGGTLVYTIPTGAGEGLIVPLSSNTNTVPAGYFFAIDLKTSSGNVTGGTFSVTDNNNNTTSVPFKVAHNYQYPIRAFEVDIVGPDGCTCSEFSSGGGTISYVASGQLCVAGGSPGVCSTGNSITCETSNATYGRIEPTHCSAELTQSVSFSTGITCPYPFEVCGKGVCGA